MLAEDIIDGRVGDGSDIGDDKDGGRMSNRARGGKVTARKMMIEDPTHRAATPRPNAKQMGRDLDTDPKILYPGGLFDRRNVVGVMGDNMVSRDLLGASPW